MASVQPFRALRFSNKAGPIDQLVCPPYDIISDAERETLLAQDEYNIIRLEKPFDYDHAADSLSRWLDSGLLTLDYRPGFYIYEQEFSDAGERKRIFGLIGDVKLEPFSAGVILPHEETLAKARGDRRDLMEATWCNFSQIYCLYHDDDRTVESLLLEQMKTAPRHSFTTGDGVTHRLWPVSDDKLNSRISQIFADKKLYIADGHHRYTTALEFHEQHAGQDTGSVMTMLCAMDNEGLVIRPTHRMVNKISGFSVESLLARLKDDFDIESCQDAEVLEERLAKCQRTLAFYTGQGRYYLLTLRDESSMAKALPQMSEASRSLDVAMLHALILEPLLGIDADKLADQSHLSYTRSADEAMALVDSGDAQCSFLLKTTTIEQLAAVSRAGEKMPQKSTYFYPKLITGLVMKSLRKV